VKLSPCPERDGRIACRVGSSSRHPKSTFRRETQTVDRHGSQSSRERISASSAHWLSYLLNLWPCGRHQVDIDFWPKCALKLNGAPGAPSKRSCMPTSVTGETSNARATVFAGLLRIAGRSLTCAEQRTRQRSSGSSVDVWDSDGSFPGVRAHSGTSVFADHRQQSRFALVGWMAQWHFESQGTCSKRSPDSICAEALGSLGQGHCASPIATEERLKRA
jgi:hypothetical protein